MAKRSYKIPATLADNYMNMEIALQSKDGIGLKPLPIRVILVWLLGIFGLFFFETNSGSVLLECGIMTRIVFAVAWIGLIVILTKVDKSHRMQVELIPAILKYIQKANRYVLTRRTANAAPFVGIVGIDSIDERTGMVTYSDGTYGYWYGVVGTASVLLFPEDRDAILDRVDDFYKKIQSDCEIIFMTTKEPQRVAKQTAHLMAQYNALVFKDPDITALVKEQYEVLNQFVGKEFKSIHQYMVIKGDNKEALSAINNIVMGEYQNSSLMFKQCVALYRTDIENALRAVYAEGD